MNKITSLKPNQIFVFGSNLRGFHGAGAAKDAVTYFGAVYGQGIGLQGQSYAIPTKDDNIQTLPLRSIENYVNNFLSFVVKNPKLEFIVTEIGCGLAGYTPQDIAPMFKVHTDNIILPESFKTINNDNTKYRIL